MYTDTNTHIHTYIRTYTHKLQDDATLAKLKDSLSGWKGPMPELVCGADGINHVVSHMYVCTRTCTYI